MGSPPWLQKGKHDVVEFIFHEVRIPPKTVIGNVQTAEIAPNMKAHDHTYEVLPLEEQRNHSRSASLPAQTPPKMS